MCSLFRATVCQLFFIDWLRSARGDMLLISEALGGVTMLGLRTGGTALELDSISMVSKQCL